MPNIKTILLGLSIVALLGTGWALYQKGKEHEAIKWQLAEAERTSEFWKDMLVSTTEALAKHQTRAADDAKALRLLNERITSLDEYVATLEDRDSVCLAGPDVDRLRDLWGTSNAD